MEWVKLKKVITHQEGNKEAKSMGWRNHEHFKQDTGDYLTNYWVYDGTFDKLPGGLHGGTISPIAVIVHGRLFPERTGGRLNPDNTIAFIPASMWETLH